MLLVSFQMTAFRLFNLYLPGSSVELPKNYRTRNDVEKEAQNERIADRIDRREDLSTVFGIIT